MRHPWKGSFNKRDRRSWSNETRTRIPMPIENDGPARSLPFLVALSGYDRARVTTYAWWSR